MSPATPNFTSFPSSRHRIECSGRTHWKAPEPQRIDFGHGNLAITAGTTSAMMSAALRPGFSVRAT